MSLSERMLSNGAAWSQISHQKFGGYQHTSFTPVHPFLITCKGNLDSESPKKLSISRRDAIIGLTALSSAVTGISSPQIAEARPRNAEMRRKIREKLELLREKAGVSKQKESESPPTLPSPNQLQLQPPPFPLPDPPLLRERSTVEANYDL